MPDEQGSARRWSGAARLGIIALLAAGLLGPLGVPLASATTRSGASALQPAAQCVDAGAIEADPYTGHVAAEYAYYCGPTYGYPPEWYAAQLGAYPQYYLASPVEPAACGTYHFYYESVWYCYTGP
jgi:hypothetical protein